MDRPASARERLRDAAIGAFARLGLDASLREIAAEVGVSAGLFTHHFGTREALRAACDDEVVRRIRELQSDGIRRSTSEQLATMGQIDEQGTTVTYLLRAVQAGGAPARAFLEHLLDDAREYVAEAVEAGIIRPSRDPEARLRYLVTQQLGGMLLQATLLGADLADGPAFLQRLAAETTLPSLELYTEGLLTSRELLDGYLARLRATS